jgi:hypothetical protein
MEEKGLRADRRSSDSNPVPQLVVSAPVPRGCFILPDLSSTIRSSFWLVRPDLAAGRAGSDSPAHDLLGRGAGSGSGSDFEGRMV